ncbi:hypothetical protein [Indioceanicola profundi]|uniref:hypothetical protein n=1 Tax=Indioceanicola profundi TaxID=2220096 RepID=UPI000E6AB261|nr:hypothetical protein [Indioceanicola profundi]
MTTTLRTALLAAALFIAPATAMAECTLSSAPQIPDGASATDAEMVAAQQAVKSYLTETQEFLGCLEAESRGRTTSDFTKRYNEASERMEKLAADFNKQLRAFKSRG